MAPQKFPPAGNERHPQAAPPAVTPHGRTIPGNTRVAAVQYAVPDPLADQLANGMAISTNTVSPMALGAAAGEPSGSFFPGLDGFGVHRFAGKLLGALQTFGSPVQPIATPKSVRVGMQAGPSSSPAFPSTGADALFGSLAAMSSNAYGSYGMSS